MPMLINSIALAELFDGFRAAADTARGRLFSRNGHRMPRFEAAMLDLLPRGHIFDGEVARRSHIFDPTTINLLS